MNMTMTLLYRFLLFPGLIIAVTSCDYKPKDEFFRDLNPNLTPPVINLNLNTLSDTVNLPAGKSFSVGINTGIVRNQWMVVYLNDVEQNTIGSSDGKFNFFTGSSLTTPGMYKLKIRVYLSTGTGSIADILDAEHFLYEKIWWLMVSENPDLGAAITGAEPENGHLKVSWTPYKGLGFSRYILLRSLNGDYQFDTIAVVKDVFQTGTYDTTYVGEKSTFVLKVYSGNNPDVYYDLLTTNAYNYYYGFPELTLEPVNEKDLKLSWGLSVFLKHITGYKIMIRQVNSSAAPTYIDVNNTQITSYIYPDPKFTFEYEFTVAFSPHTPVTMENLYDYSNTISGYPGTPSFSCNSLISPVGQNMWFMKTGRIYKYDVTTNAITDSLVAPEQKFYTSLSVSPNNKYLTAIYSTGFLFYNIQTHVSELVSFSEISPSSANFSTTNVADNGIGVVSDYDNLFLYDFVHRHLLNTATPSGEFWMNSISPDGQYIFFRNNYKYYCYRFTGGNFEKVWDDPNYLNKQFYFHATDPGKAVLYSGNTLSIVEISTWISQYNLTLDANNLFNIDFGAGRIMGYTNDYIRIYNLGNGNVEATLPTESPLHGILLKDQYIYCIEGHKLKVF